MPLFIVLLLIVAPVLTMLLMADEALSAEVQLLAQVGLLFSLVGALAWVVCDALQELGAKWHRQMSRHTRLPR
jgi:hypothetical protein